MMKTSLSFLLTLASLTSAASAADWPMWRFDAARTAVSPQQVAEKLRLEWIREYPRLKPAFDQVRQERLQFDLGYEPVVLGRTMLVGSSRNDSVTGIDTRSGEERWRFYADGPVRLAPALWNGRAYVGSDDGHLFCLDLANGKLLWKIRAVPSSRKVLGNGRLISVWPVRGGPVVADGRVYFAAGVWPFEGIFVYAVDAMTGKVLWVNDRTGCLYANHPHNTPAFGGPSPAGYLLVQGNELIVPSGRAFPARFDRTTGQLIEFEFGHGGHGSQPGGWFVATGADGKLIVDRELNTEMHDEGQQVIGQHAAKRLPGEVLQEEVNVGSKTYRIEADARRRATVGGKILRFADGFPPVSGTIHTMLAADDRLFVVSGEGSIWCFGSEAQEAKRYENRPVAFNAPDAAPDAELRKVLSAAPLKAGYAVVLGAGSGRLLEQLALHTDYRVIGLDPDAEKVEQLRRKFDQAGLYGERVALLASRLADAALPPYLASLVVSEDPEAAGLAGAEDAARLAQILRPGGGMAALNLPASQSESLVAAFVGAKREGIVVRQEGNLLLATRGGLPGAADYTGQENHDDRVHTPLGLLWFGDTVHHHKLFYRSFDSGEAGRGLPTEISVVRGVMKYETTTEPYGPKPLLVPYAAFLSNLPKTKTYLTSYTDVYTGRMMTEREAAGIRFPTTATPLAADTADAPGLPDARRNLLTGLLEARAFFKGHGCDRDAVDYGNVLTYRSGTAACYDKQVESGTIDINGTRSGCRNTIIPAGGVMTLPSWTGNCTCNYPIFTSMALAPMPESFEQWTAWGDVAQEGPIERVGVNFGAPGDRVTGDGTLWLDYPSVGGPSPNVPVETSPENPDWFYRHSVRMEGGEGPPWVTASGVKGIRSIKIHPVVKPDAATAAAFSARWAGTITAPSSEKYTIHATSDRGLRVWLAGRLILDNSKGLRRGDRGEMSASVDLTAGEPSPVVVESYAPAGARPGGLLRLSWTSPSVPKQVIPSDRFASPDGKPGVLAAAYFRRGNLAGTAVFAHDPKIDFTWGADGPAALAPSKAEVPNRRYTVWLYFAEPENVHPGERVFTVAIQGKEMLKDFDVVQAAGGRNRGVVRRFDGAVVSDALTIDFTPVTPKPPLVCGVELTAAGEK